MYKPKLAGHLTDDRSNLIKNIDQKRKCLGEIYEEIFNNDRHKYINTECETGPRITIEKVRVAIKRLKTGKRAGADNFYAELLKVMDDTGIEWLMCTSIFNITYDSGNISRSWLKSNIITLPRKTIKILELLA